MYRKSKQESTNSIRVVLSTSFVDAFDMAKIISSDYLTISILRPAVHWPDWSDDFQVNGDGII